MNAVADDKIVRDIVLLFSAVNHVDSTALEAMETLADDVRHAGLTLHLAEVKGPVMDALRDTAFLLHLAPGKVFLHANEAASLIGNQCRA